MVLLRFCRTHGGVHADRVLHASCTGGFTLIDVFTHLEDRNGSLMFPPGPFLPDYCLVGVINDLFVGSSVSEAHALDLRPAVPRRTGTTAETRGRVDAAHAHVTGLHGALIHIGAVCAVALHPVRTGRALDTLRGHRTLHPRVAGVRHAGGLGLHPPHP